jgi:hypothetical protein
MLSRTIVMDGGRRLSGTNEFTAHSLFQDGRGPTAQVVFGGGYFRQDRTYRINVPRLGTMRAAHHGNLLVGQSESLRDAMRKRCERLERLQGGAWVDREIRVSYCAQHDAVGSHDGQVSSVGAFDAASPDNLG